MRKNLLAVLAFLTLLTGCFKSENTNTVSTDGSTSMEKVIGILPDILNTIYVIFTTLIFVLPIGLGAGKWRVIKTVVIPQCIDGIVTGIILSVGIIIGESVALLFTAGFAYLLNGFIKGLISSGSTLTVALYVYAKEQGEFGVAFAIAVILLILTFIINTVAEIIGKNLKKRKQGN